MASRIRCRVYETPIPIAVTQGDLASFTLYPGVPVRLRCALGSPLPEIDEDAVHVGRVTLTAAGKEIVLEVPVER